MKQLKEKFLKRDWLPLLFFLAFFGMNFLGEILFPYEEVMPALYNNGLHYGINKFISLISIIPIALFFISLGYIYGVTKYEKSVEALSEGK